MFMRKNGLTVISYKDHFVQRRLLRTKTQEFCDQVF